MRIALPRAEASEECVPVLKNKNRSKRRVEQVVERIFSKQRLQKRLYDSNHECEADELDRWDQKV